MGRDLVSGGKGRGGGSPEVGRTPARASDPLGLANPARALDLSGAGEVVEVLSRSGGCERFLWERGELRRVGEHPGRGPLPVTQVQRTRGGLRLAWEEPEFEGRALVDGRLRIQAAGSGEPLTSLEVGPDRGRPILSGEGDWLATLGNGELALFSLPDGEERGRIPGGRLGRIQGARFSPGGAYLIVWSPSFRGEVRAQVFRTESLAEVGSPLELEGIAVFSASVSRGAERALVVVLGEEGTRVWEWNPRSSRPELLLEGREVPALTGSCPESERCYLAGAGRLLEIGDRDLGEDPVELALPPGQRPGGLLPRPGGGVLVEVHDDRSPVPVTRLWDPVEGRALGPESAPGRGEASESEVFHHVLGVRVWRLELESRGGTGTWSSLDGGLLASSEPCLPGLLLSLVDEEPESGPFYPGELWLAGPCLVLPEAGGGFRGLDLVTGETTWTTQAAHRLPVVAGDLDESGTWAVAVAEDGSTWRWRRPREGWSAGPGEAELLGEVSSGRILGACLGPRGEWLALATPGRVRLLDLESAEPGRGVGAVRVWELPCTRHGLDRTPRGELVVFDPHGVSLRDPCGEELSRVDLELDLGRVGPDGEGFVAVADRVVFRGELRRVLPGGEGEASAPPTRSPELPTSHRGEVQALVSLQGGDRILSLGRDRRALLWDALCERVLASQELPGAILDWSWSSSGERVWFATGRGQPFLLDLYQEWDWWCLELEENGLREPIPLSLPLELAESLRGLVRLPGTDRVLLLLGNWEREIDAVYEVREEELGGPELDLVPVSWSLDEGWRIHRVPPVGEGVFLTRHDADGVSLGRFQEIPGARTIDFPWGSYLPPVAVSAFSGSGGTAVWIGTEGGLRELDEGGGERTRVHLPGGGGAAVLVCTEEGRLLTGGRDGTVLVRDRSGKPQSPRRGDPVELSGG